MKGEGVFKEINRVESLVAATMQGNWYANLYRSRKPSTTVKISRICL